MWLNPHVPVGLVTLTGKSLHGTLHILCSDKSENCEWTDDMTYGFLWLSAKVLVVSKFAN